MKNDRGNLTASIYFCATIHFLTIYLVRNNNSELLSWIRFDRLRLTAVRNTHSGRRIAACPMVVVLRKEHKSLLTKGSGVSQQKCSGKILMICQRNTHRVCARMRVCVSGRWREQNISLSTSFKWKNTTKVPGAVRILLLPSPHLCLPVEETNPRPSFDGQITPTSNGN